MKNKILVSGIIALVFAVLLVTAVSVNSGFVKDTIKPQVFEKKFSISDKKYIPDEIIVKFKPGVSDEVVSRINSRHGAFVKYTSPYGRFKRIGIPKGKTVSEMVEAYEKDPKVEYAEPNYIAHALMIPNDPLYSYQWHLDNTGSGGINMEDAWDTSTGNGVIVAVIDTGVAYEDYGGKYKQAPDLKNTCFVQGYDFVNNDNHPNDDNSHGTHVTGTIAQTTNNNLGVAGVAFDACIMPVKVLDKSGSGYYSWIAEGIYYAADYGAKVISMSLGGTSSSTILENALAYAYGKGVTIVAAAGNEYEEGNPPSYPAAYDAYVIAVGATRYDETRAYYSNTGGYVDLVAPGGDLRVDQNGDGYGDGVLQNTFNPNTKNTRDFDYWFFQGTSMATPHVSGVAALVISNGNADTCDEVRAALEETAKNLGVTGRDDLYGYGLVDAHAALQWTSGPECISLEECDDGLYCNGAETCEAGVCQPGTPVICNDTNLCTDDSCNEETNSCEFVNDDMNTCGEARYCPTDTCTDTGNLLDYPEDGHDYCSAGTCIKYSCGGVEKTCLDTVCPADGCGAGTCTSDEYGTYTSVSNICKIVDNVGSCTENPCTLKCVFDLSCAAPVRCWSASYKYLMNNDDKRQLMKFCKCAQGDYAYQRYITSRRTETAYWYTDSGNNTDWDTTSGSVSRPVYKVKCSDRVYYRTDKDYYYGS